MRNLHQLFVLCTASQIIGGDFAKFCGLLRIYELYKNCQFSGEMQSKPVGLTPFQAIIKDFITKAPSKIEPKKKEVNLDPRSDLSNEDEILQELVDTG